MNSGSLPIWPYVYMTFMLFSFCLSQKDSHFDNLIKSNEISNSGIYFSDSPLSDHQEGSAAGIDDEDDLDDNASGKGFDDEDSKDLEEGSGDKVIIDSPEPDVDEEDEDDDEDDDTYDGSGDDPLELPSSTTTFVPTTASTTTTTTTTTTPEPEKKQETKKPILIVEKPKIPDRTNTDFSPKQPYDINKIPVVTTPESSTKFQPPWRPDDNNNQNNDIVRILGHKQTINASFFARPGILAAVIGGAVVGLLCAILLVMFIVYRMRKKDEGSYTLDEPKRSPPVNPYARRAGKEFYA